MIKYIEERSDWPEKIPVVNGRTLNNLVTEISPINTHIELLSNRINWLRNRLFYSTVSGSNSTASLPFPCIDIGVIPIDKKSALLFSGRYAGNLNMPLPYMLIFNKDTETLEQTSIPAYQFNCTGYCVAGDELFCFGGYQYNVYTNTSIPVPYAKAFNLITHQWRTIEGLPIPLAGHVVEYIGNNSILITAGITVENNRYKRTSRSFIYSIATNKYTPIMSYPYEIVYAGSTVIDDKVTVFGGQAVNGPINRIYQYHPNTKDWKLFAPDLSLSFYGMSIIKLGDLIIRLYGKGNNLYSTTLEVLDLTRKPYRWRNITPHGFSKLARHRFGACLIGHDTIAMFGGYIGNSSPTNNITIISY